MNPFFKGMFVLVCVAGCFLGWPVPLAYAETHMAASCSYADVSAAVAAADYGDTVQVPACESDWGENTLVVTKGIHLVGAGQDRTIIKSKLLSRSTSKVLISFETDAETAAHDYPFTFKGFHLKAEGAYPPYALLHLSNRYYTQHLTNVKISNNKFQQLKNSGYTCISMTFYPAVFGVVYKNEFIDGSHAWRFLGNIETGKTVIHWAPGSPYALYFEDNLIYITEAWDTSQIISGGNGNRYVSRYNTFDLSANGPNKFMQTHDIHGNQPNNGGGSIGFEVYGIHRLGGSGRWFDQRSGRIHFFMNSWRQTNGAASFNIWEEYDDDTYHVTSCLGLGYPTTQGGVNCLQRAYNSYYWSNFTGPDGASLVTATNVLFDHFNVEDKILNDPLTILENRSWWRDNVSDFTGRVDPVGSCGYYGGPACTKSGIGCGTQAEMSAMTTCDEGVAFWVTSQDNCRDLTGYVGRGHTQTISGTLYKCNASNTWVASYTPYTYPHPLRAGEDDSEPAAPSGLTVN